MKLFNRKKPKPLPEYLVLQNHYRKAVIYGDTVTLFSITGKKHKGECQKWPATKVKGAGKYNAALLWVKKGFIDFKPIEEF